MRLLADENIPLLAIEQLRSADYVAKMIAEVLDASDWPGHFAVVEPGRVRLREL